MKEKDENEIVEKNEEQKINIEKDNNNDDIDDDDIKDDVKLIKVSSSELIIKNKGNHSSESFEIISKEKEFSDNFGFTETSFKTLYEDDPLLSHVITHINEYIKKNDSNSVDINHLSDFISMDEFSNDIINSILLKGIPESLPCLRPLIWKSLIGFYPLNNLEQWKDETINKSKIYEDLLKKYDYYPKNIKEEQDKNLIDQINKDLPRTRFDCDFYVNNSNNYDTLRRILFLYANEHSDVHYIQGMNEIIAIIFYIFSKDDNPFIEKYKESDSYFIFEKLMEEIKDIFIMENINYSQLFIKEQIEQIKKILKKIDLELINYFEDIGVEIDNFVMRWLLVLFAQEFTMDVAVNFYDRVFTQKNKIKFICYISAAIIEKNRNTLIKLDNGGIMEWAQELQNKMNEIDITNIVQLALKIQKQYNKNEKNSISLK
jgi:hypothetical protein